MWRRRRDLSQAMVSTIRSALLDFHRCALLPTTTKWLFRLALITHHSHFENKATSMATGTMLGDERAQEVTHQENRETSTYCICLSGRLSATAYLHHWDNINAQQMFKRYQHPKSSCMSLKTNESNSLTISVSGSTK